MIKKKFPFKKPVLVAKEPELMSAEETQQMRDGMAHRAVLEDKRLAALGAQAKADLQAEKQATFEKQQAEIDRSGYKGPMYPTPGAGAGMATGISPMPRDPIYFPLAPYREPKWLTLSEAAKHLKMGPTKFAKMRSEGPKYYKLSDGTILYNMHDVNDWVMSHEQN